MRNFERQKLLAVSFAAVSALFIACLFISGCSNRSGNDEAKHAAPEASTQLESVDEIAVEDTDEKAAEQKSETEAEKTTEAEITNEAETTEGEITTWAETAIETEKIIVIKKSANAENTAEVEKNTVTEKNNKTEKSPETEKAIVTVKTVDANKAANDKKTAETEKTVEPPKIAEPQMSAREKLLKQIQSENKTITGDFTSADKWVWEYADFLFTDGRKPVRAEFITGGILETLSDDFSVDATKFKLTYPDGKSEAIWVIDVTLNRERYLADLVFDGSIGRMSRSYIYDALKRDSRFSGRLYKSLKNTYDEGINGYNITEITGRNPEEWQFFEQSTEIDSKGIAKLYFINNEISKRVRVTVDLKNKKILSEDEYEYLPKFSSSHSMPIEVGGGKYIIEQAQKGDLFLTEKQTGEQIMIYESNLGEDIEIDEIRCPYFFDIFDDRLVIYRISAAENDAGFGIYNIETKENRQFLNGFAPIYLSGSMLYIENNNSNKTNNGL